MTHDSSIGSGSDRVPPPQAAGQEDASSAPAAPPAGSAPAFGTRASASGYPPTPGQPPDPAAPLGSTDPAGRTARWGIPSAALALAFFIGTQIVIGLSITVPWVLGGNEGMPPQLTVGLATLLPAYLAVLCWQYAVTRRRGAGMRHDLAIRFRWYDLLTGIGGGLLAMGAVLGGTTVVSELTGEDAASSVGTTVLETTQTGVVLYFFLLVVAFVGPVVEELLFRGMWWRALRNWMGPALTLLLTSALFAVIHIEPVRMVGLFLGGLVLGGLRLTFDRLGPPLVAHVLINSVSAGSLFYTLVLQ